MADRREGRLRRDPARREGEGLPRGRLLAAVLVTLALASCGLEIIPYLVPPGYATPASGSSPYFSVVNVATTVVEFRGFELYYKFFASSEGESQGGFTTRAQLLASGFRPMRRSGTASNQWKPLIDVDPVDRDTDFTTAMDFNSVETSAPFAQYDGATPRPIEICRDAPDISGNYKTFWLDDLDQADADLSALTWPGSGQPLWLVVYALSYGVQDLSTDIYSDARYLGFMIYYLP